MDDPEQISEIDDHKLSHVDLYRRYNTDPETGLTNAKAEEIRNRDGPNTFSSLKITSEWMKCFRQIFGGYALLFWICAILCFFVYGLTLVTYHGDASNSYLWLGIVLIILVVATGCFSYYQQLKSSRIMDSMKYIIPPYVLAIRHGETTMLKSEDLVVGDIIKVRLGDTIGADIRILESNDFKVRNFSLTGESEPLLRSAEFTNDNILETQNLAFLGTQAQEGSAKGLVIRTGNRTVMGRIITNMMSSASTDNTPISKEISHSIYIITSGAIFLGIFYFIVALSLGYPFIESIILLIVIIIVNAPKGLLVTVTICLTVIAKKMSRKNCLIKNWESVETIGSTSIICVDKTGTLTQNQMVVAHMWFDNNIVEANFSDHQYGKYAAYDKNSNAFLAMTRCAMLCNRAESRQDSENLVQSVTNRLYFGDASEIALLKFLELSVDDVSESREANQKVCEIPFNSTNKYQVSIHDIHNDNKSDDDPCPYLLVMKGAPERILERCSMICIDGTDVEMNDYWRNAFNQAYLNLGNLGERVLGFCDLRLPDNEFPYGYQFNVEEVNFPLRNLRFLGLISMIDPPKIAAREAIMKCQSAGIKVVMITGDHPITAKAIARAVGIISEGSETVEDIAERLSVSPELVNPNDAKAYVVHGNDLIGKSSVEIDALLKNKTEIVFARVSPEQKAIIVERYQRQGAIVATIGDAVSDIPALLQADAGVSMGAAASDISKQAADVILLDDNLTSIFIIVKEGRLMFDNLKKSIAYNMTSNIVKMISVLICLLMDIPLIWGITTILCIDLMNIIGAISLLYEEAETDIMKRQPRNSQHDRLVNKRLMSMACGVMGSMQVVAGLIVYFMIMAENGFLPSSLFGMRKSWKSKDINNLQDSYGQEWTYEERKQLKLVCYSVFSITIIICQWATLVICKTRRESIVQQGMKNLMLNSGMVVETIMGAIVSYILYSKTNFNTYPLRFHWWLPAICGAFLILICDEVRKYIIRKHPGGWMERTTYY